jgi:valyl-tRNA synthetase
VVLVLLSIIDTPPPTVSGSLHLGHIYQYVIQDIPARYNRIKGNNVFFPLGYDNNGIATERFIEREKGIDRTKIDSKRFSEYYNQVASGKIEDYRNKMESLGISINWDSVYETIEEDVRRKSQQSFIELYDKGREYREKTPAIWCPNCETAISQAETEAIDKPSKYHKISFNLLDQDGSIDIETTRPELLPACVAIFINPEDDRAEMLAGEKAEVPIFGHIVKVREDKRVDMEEGLGIVMCCTFGDRTDIEWYKSRNLELRVAVDEKGKMTDISGRYQNMKTSDARREITEELSDKGYLIDSRDIEHSVQVHGRCDTPTEYRVTNQWYIKILDKREEYLGLADHINWYPKKMKTRYKNWVKGLEWDWCISRQRDVGIPVPVWYCKNCGDEILPEKDLLPVNPREERPNTECPSCSSSNFTPETDVLDTWATSSITPLINSGWTGGEEFKTENHYPMSVRPQGHDIISTWLFYTCVKCYEHTNEVPFDDVLINGHILDENMKKMSASEGNVVTPDEVISSYPVDSIRYWCAGSSIGSDIPYKEQNLDAGDRLIRKLWNASKLVSYLTDTVDPSRPEEISSSDKWILSKAQKLQKEVSSHYEEYEYEKVRRKLRTVFWHGFCDDYLEIAKQRTDNKSMSYALNVFHKSILKMFYPIMPYTCAYIWDDMYSSSEDSDISDSEWPDIDVQSSTRMIDKGEKFTDVISSIRNWKSSNGISLNEEIEKITVYEDLSEFASDIKSVAHAENIEFEQPSEMSVEVILNYSVVGPRYGRNVEDIEEYIEEEEFKIEGNRLEVGEEYTLGEDSFDTEKVPTEVKGENVIDSEVPVRIKR